MLHHGATENTENAKEVSDLACEILRTHCALFVRMGVFGGMLLNLETRARRSERARRKPTELEEYEDDVYAINLPRKENLDSPTSPLRGSPCASSSILESPSSIRRSAPGPMEWRCRRITVPRWSTPTANQPPLALASSMGFWENRVQRLRHPCILDLQSSYSPPAPFIA